MNRKENSMRKVLQIFLVLIILLMIIAIPSIGLTKTKPNSYNPRWKNQIYAKANNLEWSACPICKENFGGHEIMDQARVAIVDNNNEVISDLCSRCNLAVMDLEKNKEQIDPSSIIGRRAYFIERE